MLHQISPIGVIRSPYKEKFAIPRQPQLVSAGTGELHLLPPYHQAEMVRGLSQFSHIWVLFLFHQNLAQGWRPTVRPPRLGGNQRIGVLASRSTFRPNGIGMSAIELHGIEHLADKTILKLGSLDLLDGTPVIDVKPYLPYADSYPEAIAGYAQTAPGNPLSVNFAPQVQQQLQQLQPLYPQLPLLITQVISQDPRPAYKQQQPDRQTYGMQLYDLNIRWQIIHHQAEVISIETSTNNANPA